MARYKTKAIEYAQGLVDVKYSHNAPTVVRVERIGIGRAVIHYGGDCASWEVAGLFGHEINSRLQCGLGVDVGVVV